MYELFRNLLPKLHSSVYPYTRGYESEIPPTVSQPATQTADACNACCWGCYRSSSSLARATTPIQTQTSLFYIRFRFLLLFYAHCET